MKFVTQVMLDMIAYYSGDARRISHFLKVHSYAKLIGELEKLDADTQEILEIAALTHDIGILNSELKYKSSAGHYQQIEGPPEARELLRRLIVPDALIERVCFLIANHHNYPAVDGLDFQILVEADFLVNAEEENMSPDAIESVREQLFKTESGLKLLSTIYPRQFIEALYSHN